MTNDVIQEIIAKGSGGCRLAGDSSVSRYMYEKIEICGATFMAVVVNGMLEIFYDYYCTPKGVLCNWIHNNKPCEEDTIFRIGNSLFKEYIPHHLAQPHLNISSKGVESILKNFQNCTVTPLTQAMSTTTPITVNFFNQSNFSTSEKGEETITQNIYSVSTNATTDPSYYYSDDNSIAWNPKALVIIVLASMASIIIIALCIKAKPHKICCKKEDTEGQRIVEYSAASKQDDPQPGSGRIIQDNKTLKNTRELTSPKIVSFLEAQGCDTSSAVSTESSNLSIAGEYNV